VSKRSRWLLGNVYDVTEFLDGLWFELFSTTSDSISHLLSHLLVRARLQIILVGGRFNDAAFIDTELKPGQAEAKSF